MQFVRQKSNVLSFCLMNCICIMMTHMRTNYDSCSGAIMIIQKWNLIHNNLRQLPKTWCTGCTNPFTNHKRGVNFFYKNFFFENFFFKKKFFFLNFHFSTCFTQVTHTLQKTPLKMSHVTHVTHVTTLLSYIIIDFKNYVTWCNVCNV